MVPPKSVVIVMLARSEHRRDILIRANPGFWVDALSGWLSYSHVTKLSNSLQNQAKWSGSLGENNYRTVI
jgi:hypothetical protein